MPRLHESQPTLPVRHRLSSQAAIAGAALRPDAPAWMRLPVFRQVAQHVLDAVGDAMTTLELAPGTALMRQDEPADALYVLVAGRVHVTVCDGHGQVIFEKQMGAPAILGEAALLTGENRTATVVAASPLSCLRMERPTLEELLHEHPQCATFLTSLVGERLLASDSIRKVGKYEVRGRLGEGGMATVFAAHHPGLGRDVALKMLSHALSAEPAFIRQFEQEAQQIAHFDHAHIVRVYDTEKAWGTRFIVMEKLTGEPLKTRLQRHEPIGWVEVRRILAEVADALAYSHARGLIHRDVKPSNVFMTTEGRVKLLDFGIAVHAAASLAPAGRTVGTPAYMSPEQVLGRELDGRSDLYSLGILAYLLCTGEPPWPTASEHDLLCAHVMSPMPDPRVLAPEMPEDLALFIAQATRKQREDRFASCADAMAFLRGAARPMLATTAGLATLVVQFPTERGAEIQILLAEVARRLRELPGVRVLEAQERSPPEPPRAPRSSAPGDTTLEMDAATPV